MSNTPSDEIIQCAFCEKDIWSCDSYSPYDDAICAECDTEVTDRQHPPSLDPHKDPSPAVTQSAVQELPLDKDGNLIMPGSEGDVVEMRVNADRWVEVDVIRDGYTQRYAGFCRTRITVGGGR